MRIYCFRQCACNKCLNEWSRTAFVLTLKNTTFDKYQSTYRAAHSTETALLRVHHDITSTLDKGPTVALVMLDQSAAFDVIYHDILLHHLAFAFGISGRALKRFGLYLHDRSQCVCVRKDVSKTLPVVCGVPQESVLGPLLYTM